MIEPKTMPVFVPEPITQLAEAAVHVCRRQLGQDIRVIWFGSWVKGDAGAILTDYSK